MSNNLSPQIIYEDVDFLIINKSAGIVVNEADSIQEETVQSWARKHLEEWSSQKKLWRLQLPSDFDDQYGSPEEIFENRAGMVHRLDRETSGILVWAKNPTGLVLLMKIFKERRVEKNYLALVHGFLTLSESEVSAPIGRLPGKRGVWGVIANGREARTKYQLISHHRLDLAKFFLEAKKRGEFKGKSLQNFSERLKDYQAYSLVACQLLTGRTHQVRVHMQHLGHPLAGDQIYQGNKRKKMDAIWCSRHFLHAHSISFHHPFTHQLLKFQAPLPEDLLLAGTWLEPKISLD